ncbi:histidine utilization repressor [Aestuariispira insulae]|uniref:Histidine utilization repressor n=1 Tax=Aestuariispira insulae TaxID=1461337 RepID=A0A3D9HN84_9PROT|nr:histidine utilization repressor [Aestuariispira insulae]RED50960.1 GntR family histidine utilization transcriptional repressor [Aestuariispira insulae]
MSDQAPVPRYKMVRDHIIRNIRSGAWAADSKIPSENELVRELDVSRMTVNRALRELTSEGMLRRVQGLGSFVAGPQPQSVLLELRNIADEIRERGHAYHAEILCLEEEAASPALAAYMYLEGDNKVFHSMIVHHENEIPVQLEDRYVSKAVVPGYRDNDFTSITPNEFLVKAAPAEEVEHLVEACLPDETVADALRMEPGQPCLLLHRRTWSSGKVVSSAKLYHPGDRYRLGAHFHSSPTGQPVD